MDENLINEPNLENASPDMSGSAFIKKLDNFWYHYKWQTIIAAFFAVIFSICVFQMCDRTKYDMYIMYVGDRGISHSRLNSEMYSEYERAVEGLESISSDYDGNGDVSILFKDLYILTDAQIAKIVEENKDKEADKRIEISYALINDNWDTINIEIKSQNYYLLLMSEEVYELYKSKYNGSLFTDLSPYIKDGTNIKMKDSSAVYLNSTEFSALPLYNDLPEGTVVCLRSLSELNSGSKEAKAQFKRAEETIEKLINYKK